MRARVLWMSTCLVAPACCRLHCRCALLLDAFLTPTRKQHRCTSARPERHPCYKLLQDSAQTLLAHSPGTCSCHSQSRSHAHTRAQAPEMKQSFATEKPWSRIKSCNLIKRGPASCCRSRHCRPRGTCSICMPTRPATRAPSCHPLTFETLLTRPQTLAGPHAYAPTLSCASFAHHSPNPLQPLTELHRHTVHVLRPQALTRRQHALARAAPHPGCHHLHSHWVPPLAAWTQRTSAQSGSSLNTPPSLQTLWSSRPRPRLATPPNGPYVPACNRVAVGIAQITD